MVLRHKPTCKLPRMKPDSVATPRPEHPAADSGSERNHIRSAERQPDCAACSFHAQRTAEILANEVMMFLP